MTEARGLERDETWRGDAPLDEDVLVPKGVTLTLAPGCRLLLPARAGCRLLVEGRLLAEGDELRRIALVSRGFGGLRVLGGGRAELSSFDAAGAAGQGYPVVVEGDGELSWDGGSVEGGLVGALVKAGRARIEEVSLRRCVQGLVVDGGALEARRLRLEACSDIGARAAAGSLTLLDSRVSAGRCAVLVEGGELSLEDCRLEGQSGVACELSAGRASLTRVAVSGCRDGLLVAGAEAALSETTIAARELAAAARSGARLAVSSGSLEGGSCALHLEGGDAELEGAVLSGPRGILVEAGRLRARGARLESCGTGVELCEGAEASLEGCAFAGGERGLVAAGGRAAVSRSRFEGQREAAIDLQLGAHELDDLAISSRGSGLLIGAASARAARLTIDAEGDAAAARDGGELRLSDSKLASRACGLSHSGGLVVLERVSVAGASRGAAVGGTARLEWDGGSARGERLGLEVAGGAALLKRLTVQGGRVALRASAGEFEVEGSRLESASGPAVFLSQRAFGALRGCSLAARWGLVADGGHLHLEAVDAAACAVGLKAGPSARVCLRSAPPAAAEARRAPGALRRFVVATRKAPLLRGLYRAIYAAAVSAFGLAARLLLGAEGAWVHRGWVTGDWEAGVSDLDFVLARPGLTRGRARRFWTAFSAARRLAPFLGETLLVSPRELEAYLAGRSARSRELPLQARRLAGRRALAPDREPPTALSCLTECAHAYTRLMQWALEEPDAPWALASRQLQKSALDLLRYGAQSENPGVAAPTRAEFRESAPDDWKRLLARLPSEEPRLDERFALCAELVSASLVRFDALAREFASRGSGGAPGRAAREADAPAEKAARLRLLDEQRAGFDDAVIGAVVDDVYRSRLVLDEGYARGPLLREALVARLRLQRAAPRRATLPLLLTPALHRLLGWLPYLDCPTGFLEDAQFSSAGRLLPGAYQLRWGRLESSPPPFDVLADSLREAAANHGLTWRLMGWREAAPAAGPLAHFLLSRRLGLRLLLDGEAAPFFDLDALVEVYAERHPEAVETLAALRAPEASADPAAVFDGLYDFLDGIDIAGGEGYPSPEAR